MRVGIKYITIRHLLMMLCIMVIGICSLIGFFTWRSSLWKSEKLEQDFTTEGMRIESVLKAIYNVKLDDPPQKIEFPHNNHQHYTEKYNNNGKGNTYIFYLMQDKKIGDHESREVPVVGIYVIASVAIIILFFMYRHSVKLRHDAEHTNNMLEERVKEGAIELEKSLSVKSEFLNNINHEVRSPVQGILTFAELLVKDWHKMPEDKKITYIHHVKNNSKRLLLLVNDLLDLSRLEAGKMQFNFTKNDFVDVVRGCIDECQPLLVNKDVHIEFDTYDINIVATFDRGRIIQVIRSLLANAIKFTPSGRITAKLYRKEVFSGKGSGNFLAFSLSDNGIGIPAGELNDIFRPFTQSSRTKTGAGGRGVGLSICYEIICAHNGKIWAENNSDKGATFIFIIPLASST
jgi:signal transduction histidine kinase